MQFQLKCVSYKIKNIKYRYHANFIIKKGYSIKQRSSIQIKYNKLQYSLAIMTSKYIPVIHQYLQSKYPIPSTDDKDDIKQMTIQNIKFKFFTPYLESLFITSYYNIKYLHLNHCDLRNLQNFPRFRQLQELDLSHNQIQGTFNNLMPCKKLKFINLENNIIFDWNKLLPLKKIDKINVSVKNNPFLNKNCTGYQNKLKSHGIKIVHDSKEYYSNKKKLEEQQKKNNKKLQKKNSKNKNSNPIQSSNEMSSELSGFESRPNIQSRNTSNMIEPAISRRLTARRSDRLDRQILDFNFDFASDRIGSNSQNENNIFGRISSTNNSSRLERRSSELPSRIRQRYFNSRLQQQRIRMNNINREQEHRENRTQRLRQLRRYIQTEIERRQRDLESLIQERQLRRSQSSNSNNQSIHARRELIRLYRLRSSMLSRELNNVRPGRIDFINDESFSNDLDGSEENLRERNGIQSNEHPSDRHMIESIQSEEDINDFINPEEDEDDDIDPQDEQIDNDLSDQNDDDDENQDEDSDDEDNQNNQNEGLRQFILNENQMNQPLLQLQPEQNMMHVWGLQPFQLRFEPPESSHQQLQEEQDDDDQQNQEI